MNKVAIAVVALIAVLLLAVPPALGMLTEARVRERVAAINEGGMTAAEVKSFDRGWFHSKAKIELALSPAYAAELGTIGASADGLGAHAVVVVDFAHGPVSVQRGVHFGWSAMVATLDPDTPGLPALQRELGVPYIFEFRGRTGFGGGMAFDADVPPMNVPAGSAELKFSGATLDGSYAADRLVANARIDSFELASPGSTLVVRNLRGKTDSQALSGSLAPGNSELSIESVSAIDPLQGTAPVLLADKLRLAAATKGNGTKGMVDIQVTYDIDRVRVAENEIAGVVLGLASHNIDVAALQHLRSVVRDAKANASPDASAALAPVAADVQRLLAAGPSVVLDPIRFAFDGEPFEGRVELTTDPAKLPPDGVTDLASALLNVVNANADVKLSKGLARQLAALAAEMQFGGDARVPPEQLKYMAEAQAGLILVQLVGQGLLVEDAEVYRAALRYTDGALTLNDKPLPFGLP